MPFEVIQVIRELTDYGGRPTARKRSFCCSEVEPPRQAAWEPNTDIVESEDDVEIRLELAGVAREQLCVHLKKGKLHVAGIRQEKKTGDKVYYHQLELPYGYFAKVIALPESIEHNEITAVLNDGLLEIRISKKSAVVEIPITGISENQ
jgi:HSP20 family molecular chaperone IbpA